MSSGHIFVIEIAFEIIADISDPHDLKFISESDRRKVIENFTLETHSASDTFFIPVVIFYFIHEA